MAKTQALQTSFSSGVLNPGLAARTDIAHYYQGMQTGRNVICPKEGGARGRWGTRYIADLPGDGRLLPFSFNTEQNYCLYLGNTQMRFFRDDALVTNINGTGNPYLVTPWTLAEVTAVDYTQSADTLVLAHRAVETRTIVRGADHNLWTLATAGFTNIPDYDFNDADSPTPTSHVVDLAFGSFSTGQRYKLELNGFETPEIIWADNSTAEGKAANERRIAAELLLLPPTGFAAAGITVAFQSGSTYRVTFSADSADLYEPMTGRNTDSTAATVTATTVTPGVARREPVWSATRGWPRTVAFYENRLIIGGSFSLPQSLFGSVIGDFFNFELGTGLDDEGIFITVNTNQVNEIRSVYPGRHLQVFTSGGEFYSPDRPLTPAMALPQQSRFGSAEGIKPVEVDGATIFLTRQRKTLREYLFLWAEEAYNATSLSVLASHLLKSVRDVAAQTSTDDEDDSYVFAVNEDGTAAVLNTLRAQDIAAWTEFVTRSGDAIRSVAVVGDEIYVLAQRARNGQLVYQLEKLTFETRLDASVKVTTGLGIQVSGFDALAGETVQVLVDGAPIDDLVVTPAGKLNLPAAAESSVEAGYFCAPVVQTMPLVVQLGGEALLGARKRIQEIRARVKDTLGLVANGRLIPDQATGVTQSATPQTPFTGLRKIGDLGWTDDDATITLTQRQPLPFHVLGLSGVLEVGST